MRLSVVELKQKDSDKFQFFKWEIVATLNRVVSVAWLEVVEFLNIFWKYYVAKKFNWKTDCEVWREKNEAKVIHIAELSNWKAVTIYQ